MLLLRRLPFALLLIAANLVFARSAMSQNTPEQALPGQALAGQALTVDAVLARVRANVAAYTASIPNVICEESVDSRRTGGGKVKDEMKIESSFSIVRSGDGKNLRETRVKNLVNGSKPKNQKVSPPYAFSGGIANVIEIVDDKCSSFAFARDGHPAGDAPIVIVATPRAASQDLSAACARELKQSFRAKLVIDPQSFQVHHLECSMQDISFGLASHVPFVPLPSTHNDLAFAVDFAPTSLGGKTFWLSQTVTSTVTDKNKPITLEYEAHYTNYHRFAATTTVLPDVTEVSNP